MLKYARHCQPFISLLLTLSISANIRSHRSGAKEVAMKLDLFEYEHRRCLWLRGFLEKFRHETLSLEEAKEAAVSLNVWVEKRIASLKLAVSSDKLKLGQPYNWTLQLADSEFVWNVIGYKIQYYGVLRGPHGTIRFDTIIQSTPETWFKTFKDSSERPRAMIQVITISGLFRFDVYKIQIFQSDHARRKSF